MRWDEGVHGGAEDVVSYANALCPAEDFPEAPDTIGMQDERGGRDTK
jgi:hypothetical protein